MPTVFPFKKITDKMIHTDMPNYKKYSLLLSDFKIVFYLIHNFA